MGTGAAVSPPPAKRILIRGTNWIGDLVMISPALEAVRETWPQAHVTLLVRSHLAAAMRAHPALDEVLAYERTRRHRPPFGTLRLARELRERRFDLALLFPKSFESALIAWLAGIDRRAGWRTDGRGMLLTHGAPLGPEDRKRHHMLQFLEVARFAGCVLPDSPVGSFYVSAEDRAAVDGLLAERAADAEFLLAVHPGASKPPRSWHHDRFAAAADRILADRNGLLVLLGGPGDRPECSRIRGAARAASVNLAGKTTIGQMAAILERADLLLCNDSGPMHVAGALGTPHVAVFGPGTPERTLPVTSGDLGRAVTLDFPCSPCRQRFFKECRPGPWNKPWCLEDLPVSMVTDAARELLGNRV